MSEQQDHDVGYGRPPKSTRFKKGQSGNPHGRPKGRKTEIPYDAVLGQTVTIREDGAEKTMTAAEAFLLSLAKQGLEGDTAAARQTLATIEDARAKRLLKNDTTEIRLVYKFASPGSVTSALEPLRMARKLDRYGPTARMALEPWIVEAALARLGERQLSPEEQRTVVEATRTPRKVKWPEWWTELPE
ncbi:DUF5681 domain-containing protein [Rhodophyticola porphyridii]|uniref:DUF5681 domain-containing protein n=1 Tax=Rhodophyticola porphyridii TaxID=1852017 RepID=A0A3L9Y7R8_9RHOB|nr:DUF5681 domain-containing protein [Rhodophyticola porphyridii]RMA42343.1 hypothetical protein D9R08_09555 [Rhodophyticola porphyridii]